MRTHNVSSGLMYTILKITKDKRNTRFNVYKIAGPRYILTFETSSEILFRISPFWFDLKKEEINNFHIPPHPNNQGFHMQLMYIFHHLD